MITNTGTVFSIRDGVRSSHQLPLNQSISELLQLALKVPIAAAITGKRYQLEFVNEKFVTSFGYGAGEISESQPWWRPDGPSTGEGQPKTSSFATWVEKVSCDAEAKRPMEYRLVCRN